MAGLVHIWPKVGLKQPSIFLECRFIIHNSIQVSQEPWSCDWWSIELYRPHC